VSFLAELKQFLVDESVAPADAIFRTSNAVIPTGDGPYLLLVEYGGMDSAKTQNNTATERPTAQISSRAKSSSVAWAQLKAAYDALGGPNGLHNVELSGVKYLRLVARQNITDSGKDGAGRPLFVFNIEAEKAPS
jgi:hypothetical protein